VADDSLSICHVVDTLDPAAGGPPAVALHLAAEQVRAGHRPFVLHGKAAGAGAGVEAFVEQVTGSQSLRRLEVSGGRGAVRGAAAQAVGEADVVQMHGVWSRLILATGRAAERAGRPYILRPAGMFEPWSLAQKKWKKRIGLALGFRRLVDRAGLLHATADQEAEQFRRLGFGNPIAVIANGVDAKAYDLAEDRGAVEAQWPVLGGKRILLFMSRVHPKKGLPNLVEAFAQVAGDAKDWHVVIAGPDSAGHAAAVAERAAALGIGERVLMTGPVYGPMKVRLMQAAEAFVLPTHSENFGVVIAEALAARMPVITTRGTPWRELEEHGCGWWIDIGVEPLATVLAEVMLRRSATELAEMGRAGRALVEQRYGWAAIGRHCEEVYRWLIGVGPEPGALWRV